MKTHLLFSLLCFSYLFLNINCKDPNSGEGADIIPPDPPRMIPKSSDIAKVENGIDAEAGKNAIRVEWFFDIPDEEDLGGYEIFRTEYPKSGPPVVVVDSFQLLKSINVDLILPIESDSVFIDFDIGWDTTYYYYLIAFDESGNRSNPSDTVHYTLIEPPILINVDVSTTEPVFKWGLNRGIDPTSYILRVGNFTEGANLGINREGGKIIYISRVTPNFGGDEVVTYNNESPGLGEVPQTIIWIDSTELKLRYDIEYQWRVDAVEQEGDDFWGSESSWSGRFLIDRNSSLSNKVFY